MPNPGMSPEVQQAIQRRQGSQPTLNQRSPQAAQISPVPAPQDPSKASSPQDAKPPKYEAQNQDDLIVMALIEKTKNNDKFKKEQLEMNKQPAPQKPSSPPQAPTPPMGGGGFSLSPGFSMSPMNKQSDYQGGRYSALDNYGKGQGINRI